MKSPTKLTLPEQISLRELIIANSIEIEGKDYRIWKEGWDFARALATIAGPDRFSTDTPARHVARALGITVKSHVEGAIPAGTLERISGLEQRLEALEGMTKMLTEKLVLYRSRGDDEPLRAVLARELSNKTVSVVADAPADAPT